MGEPKNIAVYSGSFNPLHIGHLAIIRHLIGKGGFDCVYLIVSPKNPLKEGISSASGRERYEAAVCAVSRHFGNGDMTGRVMVDDIELDMPEPHYTIRTLDTLRKREPLSRFTLVMGADNLSDIRRWKDYVRILTEYGVAVYPREGYDLRSIREEMKKEDPSYEIRILDAPQIDISSTEIREGIAAGKDMSEWLM